jgi:ATP-dependent Zn protease
MAENGLVAIEKLAGSLTDEQALYRVDITGYEVKVLAAHQYEAALRGIHEAGHTVIAALLGIRVKTADISLRHAGETTLGWNDETEVAFTTATRMNDLVVATLSGMEAERHFMGELTDGATGDLRDATDRCMAMIAAGMEPSIGVSYRSFGAYNGLPHPNWLIDRIARAVDARIKLARDRARELAQMHAAQILEFARLLVAAPDRRLSDEGLDNALRVIGIEPPPGASPVGGVRRARRRRRA